MRAFPSFTTTVRGAVLVAHGDIQPTPISETYRVRIGYEVGKAPKATVLAPELVCREGADKIPHMYGQKTLCLYRPGRGEWWGDMPLGLTLIPWISEWLYYYEMWHFRGEWLGGGEEPTMNEPICYERERINYEHPGRRR